MNLPGHGPRIGEKAFTQLPLLIDAIADQIGCELAKPFVLYGHSMGALVSFELRRELFRRYSSGPLHLFLSGRSAPHVQHHAPQTFHLSDEEFIAALKYISGSLHALVGNPETKELFLPMLRADFELVQTYEFHPGQTFSCPITIYGGLQDQNVPVESLRGWAVHSSADFRIRMFKGDDFFIHKPERDFVAVLRSDVLTVLQGIKGSP